MKYATLLLALLALGACSRKAETDSTAPASAASPVAAASGMVASPVPTDAPAGAYTLDKAHSTLLFRVNHVGFSRYTASFRDFDATLQFDPTSPEKASVTATVDPSSLQIAPPPLGFLEQLLGPQWLDAGGFPEITFKSTNVVTTGSNKARVVGDLTLRGVTQPIVLDVTFNGGYAGHELEPAARIGFSATATLSRSAFGVDLAVPAPGSTIGVGDAVEVIIETEFNGPALAGAAE